MASRSLLQVEILGLYLHALLYGLYALMFLGTLLVLITKGGNGHLNQPLLVFSIATFILMTADAVCLFLLVFWTTDALYFYGKPLEDWIPLGSYMKEDILKDVVSTLINALENTMVLLADVLLMWRAFVISGRKTWILISATMLLLGEAVCGYGQVVTGVMLTNLRRGISATATTLPAEFVKINTLQDLLDLALNVLMFITNVSLSTIIASMLWRANQMAKKHSQETYSNRYLSLMLIIIESGAFYSATSILAGIFALVETTMTVTESIFSSLSWGLSGIAPTSIIIIVGLGKTWEQTHGSQNTGRASTMQFASRPAPADTESQAEIRDIELVVREVPVEHGGKPAAAVEAHASQP